MFLRCQGCVLSCAVHSPTCSTKRAVQTSVLFALYVMNINLFEPQTSGFWVQRMSMRLKMKNGCSSATHQQNCWRTDKYQFHGHGHSFEHLAAGLQQWRLRECLRATWGQGQGHVQGQGQGQEDMSWKCTGWQVARQRYIHQCFCLSVTSHVHGHGQGKMFKQHVSLLRVWYTCTLPVHLCLSHSIIILNVCLYACIYACSCMYMYHDVCIIVCTPWLSTGHSQRLY